MAPLTVHVRGGTPGRRCAAPSPIPPSGRWSRRVADSAAAWVVRDVIDRVVGFGRLQCYPMSGGRGGLHQTAADNWPTQTCSVVIRRDGAVDLPRRSPNQPPATAARSLRPHPMAASLIHSARFRTPSSSRKRSLGGTAPFRCAMTRSHEDSCNREEPSIGPALLRSPYVLHTVGGGNDMTRGST